MEVVRFNDAREFREYADPLLLADEAANNLILGVTGNVIERPDSFEAFLGWVIVDDGQPTAAAAQTVPYNLILAVPRSAEAVELLASETGDIPGVVGCRPGVDDFVAARKESHRLERSQGVFQLEAVTLPTRGEGVSRPARFDEIDELADMWIAFEDEAIGHVEDA